MPRVVDRGYKSAGIPYFAGAGDENFLVEVPGFIVPDADLLLYGLMKSPISDKFPRIFDVGGRTQAQLYYDLAFFDRPAMMMYLANVESYEEYLEATHLTFEDTLRVAREYYFYTPCNNTIIRLAILSSAIMPFVKSLTFVFDEEPKKCDIDYFGTFLTETLRDKTTFAYGSTADLVERQTELRGEGFRYTSIFTNDFNVVDRLTSSEERVLSDNELFILLRNHSGNTELGLNPENPDEFTFREMGTNDILKRLHLPNGMPISKIVFARFEPTLSLD